MAGAVTGDNDQTPAGTVAIYLTDTETGRTAVIETDFFEDFTTELAAYYIGEGNGSCDCVRAEWLDPEGDDVACGDGRIRVDKVIRKSDGAVIYREDE